VGFINCPTGRDSENSVTNIRCAPTANTATVRPSDASKFSSIQKPLGEFPRRGFKTKDNKLFLSRYLRSGIGHSSLDFGDNILSVATMIRLSGDSDPSASSSSVNDKNEV
jgi:hypothetical protein